MKYNLHRTLMLQCETSIKNRLTKQTPNKETVDTFLFYLKKIIISFKQIHVDIFIKTCWVKV